LPPSKFVRFAFTALLLLTTGCGVKHAPPNQSSELAVRFRPQPEPESQEAQWILSQLPGATWDQGLYKATQHLIGASRDRLAQLTPEATTTAQGLAGYPGNARFFRELTGGGPPDILVENLKQAAAQRQQAFDVGLAAKIFGDGTVLWIGAIAHRPALLDPIPAVIPLDGRIPVGIEILDTASGDPMARIPNPVLFLTTPFGAVKAYPLKTQTARWIDDFHTPGPTQMEVVARGDKKTQVVLKWTVFVDAPAGKMPALLKATGENPDPFRATIALYSALNQLRSQAGLAPVTRFEGFEPLAREHAALMAASGVVDHHIPNRTPGVAAIAAKRFHPGAMHHENLAAAPNWQEALDLVRLSPGHLANLLCEPCTHASIGVALEPVLDRTPRLFVVWELLEFPQGPPSPVPQR
jgi:hypothetical protein